MIHAAGRKVAVVLVLAAALLGAAAARAGLVAEGTYTVTAPDRAVVAFRMVLTRSGARIVETPGDTLAVSYAKATALLLDARGRSYVPLPLGLVPPLLAEGLGYDPGRLGFTATGATKRLLGHDAGEVLVTGTSPRLSVRAWRVADGAFGDEYALFERALGMPWTTGAPPAVFTGLPLAGSVEIDGRRPYRASWEITKVVRDDRAVEDFTIPDGYRMDLERLISTQTRGR
jgi:hypothetical protein